MPPPPSIFYHLQKTGGTSLRGVLRQVYGEAAVQTANYQGDWTSPAGPEIRDGMSAWMGHMSFGIHEVLPVAAPYFTIMRDPAARMISRYRSAPKFSRNSQSVRSCWLDFWGAVYQLSAAPKREIPLLDESHLAAALNNLREHFLYIGDTTRMDELGLWLRDGLGWDIPLPLPWENKAFPGIDVTDEQWEEARTAPELELDRELYALVQELGPEPKRW